MAIEIEHLRTLEQVGGKNYWKGVKTFLTYDSMVQTESLALWNKAWPGMSGDTAPVCKHTQAIFHPSGVPSVAMILAYYETARKPGKARLITRTTSTKKKLFIDVNGKIIEGPDPEHISSFFQPDGDNHVEEYHTILELETAYYADSFQLPNVLALENCVNDSTLTLVGFGTVQAETLKCLGVITNREYGADMIDITYLFMWSGPDETWNSKLKSQLGSWVLQKLPVFDTPELDRNAVLVDWKTAPVWKPWSYLKRYPNDRFKLIDTTPEARQLYKKKNFATQLSGLAHW